jgi:hypothetical protein
MDSTHYVELSTYFPYAKIKMDMLSAYSDSEPMDIPDPCLEDDATLQRCYAAIDLCLRNLAAELSEGLLAGAHTGGIRG